VEHLFWLISMALCFFGGYVVGGIVQRDGEIDRQPRDWQGNPISLEEMDRQMGYHPSEHEGQ
jgi:hypothetical protein